MEIFSTDEFDNDIKKIDKNTKLRIGKITTELKRSNFIGKPLKHAKNVYSLRIENKRLVYTVEGDKVLLLFFKSRENVYDYLRQ